MGKRGGSHDVRRSIAGHKRINAGEFCTAVIRQYCVDLPANWRGPVVCQIQHPGEGGFPVDVSHLRVQSEQCYRRLLMNTTIMTTITTTTTIATTTPIINPALPPAACGAGVINVGLLWFPTLTITSVVPLDGATMGTSTRMVSPRRNRYRLLSRHNSAHLDHQVERHLGRTGVGHRDRHDHLVVGIGIGITEFYIPDQDRFRSNFRSGFVGRRWVYGCRHGLRRQRGSGFGARRRRWRRGVGAAVGSTVGRGSMAVGVGAAVTWLPSRTGVGGTTGPSTVIGC